MPMKKIHSLLYAMEQVPDIGKTKLVKFVFFTDLVSLNQRGFPVFDSTFIRMPKGPVDQFAYSMAGDSNAFFDVTVPAAITALNARFPTRAAGRIRARATPQRTQFTPKITADTSLFSAYEKTLFDSVLRVLRSHTATSISEITHQLRLWREYNDGDTIPPEALLLEEDETDFLRAHGFFFDGFSRQFCDEIARDVHLLEDLVHPLNPVRTHSIMSTLDRLVKAYPVREYESFYDAYLAWDDAYRLALQRAPEQLPALAAKGSEALCTYALEKETGYLGQQARGEFAEAFTREVEAIRSSILEQRGEAVARSGDVEGYVDRLMRISCDLALQR